MRIWFAIALLISPAAARGQEWTQFDMKKADAGSRFLWTEPQNWNRGLPGADLSVEIGDDTSKRALHCVIPTGTQAICQNFELAEHGGTQGTTLRIEKDASLTILEGGVLSKDRESWCYVDGSLICTRKRRGLRVGGPWGNPAADEPATCHLIVGPEGSVDAWFIGINTDFRGESAPSVPWGEKFWARSTGSEIVVDGGKLRAREGLRFSTTDSQKPGALRLNGKATFSSDHESEYGIDVWGGIWEIDGGDAAIDVGDIEFWGNKFKDAVSGKTGKAVGAGTAVLKLTGKGISTIRAAELNFVDAAVIDVSELEIPAGTYTVFDGDSFEGANLELAPETDSKQWHLRFDMDKGDVLLEFAP